MNKSKPWLPKLTCSNKSSKWPTLSGALAGGGWKQHRQTDMSTTYNWDKPGPKASRTESETISSAGGSTLSMDEDVHSDEGHGVTSLGYLGHQMTDVPL